MSERRSEFPNGAEDAQRAREAAHREPRGAKSDDGAEGAEAHIPSFGPMSEHHWSRARAGQNAEALEYLRWRSRAPGVAEGGAERNHYCTECHGVIPLRYDQRQPAAEAPERCPHCGAELDPRIRAMFNWVEIDQPPPSDRRMKLVALVLVIALVALVALLVALLT